MSILQFLRIVWSGRLIVLVATSCCFVGAIGVILLLPARWEAKSRVLMNLLKPDPVTGQIIAGPASRAYVATQTELIKDYSVAGQVADQLGWLSDPVLIKQYQSRSKDDVRDFRRWLAQIVIARTKTQVVQGSNILEITYTATTPDQAARVADALRKAYIDASLAFRRDDANRNAEWFSAQAEKALAALNEADKAKSDYERTNGIVMADDKTDIDSARLRALTGQAGTSAPAASVTAPVSSAASVQLAQIDAQIAQQSQILGPNHPELQDLRNKRASIAALVAQDQRTQRASAGASASAAAAGMGALDRAVATQKARVLAQSDKIQRLNQLQAEVDLRRDQYNKTASRVAELRQEGAIADVGLQPLGSAVVPQSPSFPNIPLIIVGSLGLGMATGILISLLMEMLRRRVRGVEDLQTFFDIPLLAVIAPPPREPTSSRRMVFGRSSRSNPLQA